MYDTYTQENQRDFAARYCDTFGWLIDEKRNNKRLVYLAETDGDHLYFYSQLGGVKQHTIAGAGVMFEFIPVDHGWFKADNGAIYLLTRVPARQWKRGISRSNTSITGITGNNVPVNFEVMSSIFNEKNPQTYTYSSARPIALSKHFAIDAKKNVFFYDSLIGTEDNGIITLKNNHVLQELQDLVRRKKLPLEIKVG